MKKQNWDYNQGLDSFEILHPVTKAYFRIPAEKFRHPEDLFFWINVMEQIGWPEDDDIQELIHMFTDYNQCVFHVVGEPVAVH